MKEVNADKMFRIELERRKGDLGERVNIGAVMGCGGLLARAVPLTSLIAGRGAAWRVVVEGDGSRVPLGGEGRGREAARARPC